MRSFVRSVDSKVVLLLYLCGSGDCISSLCSSRVLTLSIACPDSWLLGIITNDSSLTSINESPAGPVSRISASRSVDVDTVGRSLSSLWAFVDRIVRCWSRTRGRLAHSPASLFAESLRTQVTGKGPAADSCSTHQDCLQKSNAFMISSPCVRVKVPVRSWISTISTVDGAFRSSGLTWISPLCAGCRAAGRRIMMVLTDQWIRFSGLIINLRIK